MRTAIQGKATHLWWALAALVAATSAGTVFALLVTPGIASIGRICSTALIVLVFGLVSLGGASLLARRAESGAMRVIDIVLGAGAVVAGLAAAVWLLNLTWDIDARLLDNSVMASLAGATVPLAAGVVLRLLGRSSIASATAMTISRAGGVAGAALGVLIVLSGSTGIWGVLAVFGSALSLVEAGALIAVPIMLARASSAAWSARTGETAAGLNGARKVLVQLLLTIAGLWRVLLRVLAAAIIGLTALGVIAILIPDAVTKLFDAVRAVVGVVPDPVWDACGQISLTACVVLVCGLGVLIGQRLRSAEPGARGILDRALGAVTMLTAAVAVAAITGVVWDLWGWPDPFDGGETAKIWRLVWGLADVAILFAIAGALRLWSRGRATRTALCGLVAAAALSAVALFLYGAGVAEFNPLDDDGLVARGMISLFVIAAAGLVLMPLLERTLPEAGGKSA